MNLVLPASRKPVNKYTGIFFIAVIEESLKKFTYGDQISSKVLPELVIKLPVNESGMIDLDYMEEAIIKAEGKSAKRLEILKEIVG